MFNPFWVNFYSYIELYFVDFRICLENVNTRTRTLVFHVEQNTTLALKTFTSSLDMFKETPKTSPVPHSLQPPNCVSLAETRLVVSILYFKLNASYTVYQ